jgi:L-fuculose-phosphate aldolase
MYQIKKSVAQTSQYIYKQGLAPGKSGNVSMKKDEVVAITATKTSLREVKSESVALVSLDGKIISEGVIPSSELELHLMIYNERDDVKGIVHTHSPYATGFALAGKKINRLEGFGPVHKSHLEMVEYAPPGSSKLAQMVKNSLKKEDVLIMEGHGVVCVGTSLNEALLLAEWVEKTAETLFVANILKNIVKRKFN